MEFDMLSKCTSGGCGAKIGIGELSELLKDLPNGHDDNLLIGFDTSDDAAVYKISDDIAVVSTVDFFSPMLNDPYVFGQIAATNALSDVYAMGGDVRYVLNLVCFPQSLDKQILKDILRGGAEKIKEAGAVVSGGHSIYDHEPKYGLSVNGIVHPDKFYRNNTPKLNDKIILTKALGVGTILSAYKEKAVHEEAYQDAVASMTRLNKYAAEKLKNYKVNACTDVTGFGLCNHLLEMVNGKYTAFLYKAQLPVLQEAYKAIEEGYITGGGKRNRSFGETRMNVEAMDTTTTELLFDPQTSGGLLISIAQEDADALLADIQKDDPSARIIGEMKELSSFEIVVK